MLRKMQVKPVKDETIKTKNPKKPEKIKTTKERKIKINKDSLL